MSKLPLSLESIFKQTEPLPAIPGLRSVQELETQGGEVGQDFEVAHLVALKSEIALLQMPQTRLRLETMQLLLPQVRLE